MKLLWLLNGTMQAHHLAAAYLAVWLIQGGYAGWIGWQWVQLRRSQEQAALESRRGS